MRPFAGAVMIHLQCPCPVQCTNWFGAEEGMCVRVVFVLRQSMKLAVP